MTRPFSPISNRRGPDRFYDAIIIGSGIGGLICATLLARDGLKVLLIEQHYMVGGYCSGFRRQGYLFDAASHFYPLLGNSASISGRLLRDLGSSTEWVKMDPVDQFHLPDGSHFEVPADFNHYIALLKNQFPHEASALDRFFHLARKLYLFGILRYFQGCETSRLKRFEDWTVRDALNRYFTSDRLKLLLTADCPHWGSPPSRTSFVFDSMLRLSYFEGNYYARGGSQAFADDLAHQFTAFGGQVLMKSLVRRIVVRHGQATGVEIETGPRSARFIATANAGCVISNADMRQTVLEMVGEEHFPAAYVSHLRELRPSFSCFLSHIGVTNISSDVLRNVHGYYWNDWNSDRVGSDAFHFKLFVPTLYEPRFAPPGCHIIIVQKVIDLNYKSVTDWKLHKQHVERFVLDRLDKIIPGVQNKIAVCQSASAQTSHRFTLNYQGAMLGWEMSPSQLGQARPGIECPVKNLYFVGQWTQPGGGITPVIISAMNAARRVTGSHLLPLRHSRPLDRDPTADVAVDFDRETNGILDVNAPKAAEVSA